MKRENNREIEALLKEHDLRVTSQRLCILEALYEKTGIHPTIDDIYHLTRERCPGMAMATVYNNVGDFVEKGILKELPKEHGRTRYDAELGEHAHFECKVCGELYNIFDATEKPRVLEGFDVDDVFYKGTCHKCKNLD